MRNLMNNNIFLLRLKIWWKCSEKVQFFSFILIKILLISLFLTSESRRVFGVLQWLLIKVSVRYQNRPCLGREWVIGHQHLRRFRSNNRVLQNIAIYGRPCRWSILASSFSVRPGGWCKESMSFGKFNPSQKFFQFRTKVLNYWLNINQRFHFPG